MSLRPDKLPRWATTVITHPTTGVPTVIEPLESAKDAGWDYLEKPGHAQTNWLMNRTYEWLNFIDEQLGFAPAPSNPPDNNINLGKGYVITDMVKTEKAAQSFAITFPTVNPRIDAVCIDDSGTIFIVAGSEAASPVKPTPTHAYTIIAYLNLYVGQTEITVDDIEDVRTITSHLPFNRTAGYFTTNLGFGIGTQLPFTDVAGGTYDVANVGAGLHLKHTSLNAHVLLESPTPAFSLINSAASADWKWWQLESTAGYFHLKSRNDDGTTRFDNLFKISLGNYHAGIGTGTPGNNGVFNHSGTDSVFNVYSASNSGIFTISGNTVAIVDLVDIGSGVNSKVMRFVNDGTGLQISAINDSGATKTSSILTAKNDIFQRIGVGTADPLYNLAGSTSDFTSTVGLHLKNAIGGSAALVIEGTTDSRIDLIDTAAAADAKWLEFIIDGGIAKFLSRTDLGAINQNNILTFHHTLGYIGIGAEPSGSAQIYATTALNQQALFNTTSAAGVYHTYTVSSTIQGHVGSGTSLFANGSQFGLRTGAGVGFAVSIGSSTERFVINTDGHVGVNTPTPGDNIAGGWSGATSVDSIFHVKAGSTGVARIVAEGGNAAIGMVDSDAAVNNKWMDLVTASGFTSFSSVNDTGSVNQNNIISMKHSNGHIGMGVSPGDICKVEIRDGGTSASVLFKLTADDGNPIPFMIGNDTYSVTDTEGLGCWVTDAGVSSIHARGTASELALGANGSEALRVNASQNIGHGVNAPGDNLAGGTYDLTSTDRIFHIKGSASKPVHQVLEGDTANLHFIDLNGAADDKWIRAQMDGGKLVFSSMNDNGTVKEELFTIASGLGGGGGGGSPPTVLGYALKTTTTLTTTNAYGQFCRDDGLGKFYVFGPGKITSNSYFHRDRTNIQTVSTSKTEMAPVTLNADSGNAIHCRGGSTGQKMAINRSTGACYYSSGDTTAFTTQTTPSSAYRYSSALIYSTKWVLLGLTVTSQYPCIWESSDNGSTWTQRTILSVACDHAVGLTYTGSQYIATFRSSTTSYVYKSSDLSSWSSVETLTISTAKQWHSKVASDGAGNVMLTYGCEDNYTANGDVYFKVSTDHGSSWTSYVSPGLFDWYDSGLASPHLKNNLQLKYYPEIESYIAMYHNYNISIIPKDNPSAAEHFKWEPALLPAAVHSVGGGIDEITNHTQPFSDFEAYVTNLHSSGKLPACLNIIAHLQGKDGGTDPYEGVAWIPLYPKVLV